MYKHIVLLAVCCACVMIQYGLCQQEKEPCELPSGSGTCKKAVECPEILEDLNTGLQPKLCGIVGNTAVVCCRSLVTSKPTTKEPVTSDHNYSDNYDTGLEPDCAPIPVDATKVQKRGSKAWDKCIDYLQYVYLCEDSGALTFRPQHVRRYRCHHEVNNLMGTQLHNAAEREFPHMAHLGFGPSESTVSWQCGGTVISENFVMTAGHCTFARDLGSVTFIRVGMTVRSYPIDKSRIHRVAEIIKHPEYKPPSIYNDIALIKTATPIQLDNRVYPACLHSGNIVDDHKMMATGWGKIHLLSEMSDTLHKVNLEKFTEEECKDSFPPHRKYSHGFQQDSQICAGQHTEGKGTCQGDGGGPLQIYNLDVKCMYTVVGVTSFGSGCNIIGVPDLYTRVSHYISWIESVVWP